MNAIKENQGKSRGNPTPAPVACSQDVNLRIAFFPLHLT